MTAVPRGRDALVLFRTLPTLTKYRMCFFVGSSGNFFWTLPVKAEAEENKLSYLTQ